MGFFSWDDIFPRRVRNPGRDICQRAVIAPLSQIFWQWQYFLLDPMLSENIDISPNFFWNHYQYVICKNKIFHQTTFDFWQEVIILCLSEMFWQEYFCSHWNSIQEPEMIQYWALDCALAILIWFRKYKGIP